MNITEVSKRVDKIVEAVFSKNDIEDKSDRIQLLRKCMHVLDTSNTNEILSIDDEYSDEMEIFLNGKWRFLI